MNEQEILRNLEKHYEPQLAGSRIADTVSEEIKATLLKILKSGNVEVSSKDELSHLITLAESIKKNAKIKVKMGNSIVTAGSGSITIKNSNPIKH
jgi:hypothetical protein